MVRQWYQCISYTNDSISNTISCLKPLLNSKLWNEEECQLIIFEQKVYNPFVHWEAVIVFQHRIVKVGVLLGRKNSQFSILKSVEIGSIIQVSLGGTSSFFNRVNVHIEYFVGGINTNTNISLPAGSNAAKNFMSEVHLLRQINKDSD